MYGHNSKVRNWIGFLILSVVVIATSASAQDRSSTRRIERQVHVMERIFDQMLLDSPNYLVNSEPFAHGIHLPDYGVLITFEANLYRKDSIKSFSFEKLEKLEHGFSIDKDESGKIRIVIPEFGDDDDEELSVEGDEDWADRETDGDGDKKSWREHAREEGEDIYRRGRVEIVSTLLDYGDTFTALDDDSRVTVAAFLEDHSLFEDDGLRKLVISARVGDLRDYARGEISEEEAIRRLVEEIH